MRAAGVYLMLLTLASTVHAITPRLTPFDLKDVRLLPGHCLTAQEADARYLLSLDPDRLLYSFRVNAGLPSPGKPYGGWEAPDCEVRGHFVGHYLSACALMYASTGDQRFKDRADLMVTELAKCQKAIDGLYLSAYPATFFDRLESMQNPPWAPYYTIHKIMAGMFDMYTLAGNEQALDVLKKMAAYFKKRTDKLPPEAMDRVLTNEFGGMSEVLHNLFGVTKDPAHLDLAHRFDQASFLGPLAIEKDNLSRIHANTHIPKICGAARRYELTGDETYHRIVAFFWDRVATTRSYATGGSNQDEHWSEAGKLAATLSDKNQECCTTYNMLKVTRYLERWTGDPKYADYYERNFFNGILGTQDPNGMLMYFVPQATGHTKKFGGPLDAFWCCTGTGIESFAKLGDSVYFHDADALTVNLFVASTVTWAEKGLTLEQTTRFPEEEGTRLALHLKQPVNLALNIHVPEWATRGVRVLVNGQEEKVDARPSSYAAIRREWKDGDTVDVRMPMTLRTQPMPDDPDLVAVLYGPLVLAGLASEKTGFLADAADPASWLKPVEGKALTFRTAGQTREVTFIPLYKVMTEPYGVYWLVFKEGSARHKEALAEEEARKKREARTVDRVVPNNPEMEKSHNLQGENTQAGTAYGRAWRHAPSGGWWSWDLKVLGDAPMVLACTYYGGDVGPRTFDVLVDGEKIATQSIDHPKPGEFFTVEHKLPPELTHGKPKITVQFRPHDKNTAGGVFECATLRGE